MKTQLGAIWEWLLCHWGMIFVKALLAYSTSIGSTFMENQLVFSHKSKKNSIKKVVLEKHLPSDSPKITSNNSL